MEMHVFTWERYKSQEWHHTAVENNEQGMGKWNLLWQKVKLGSYFRPYAHIQINQYQMDWRHIYMNDYLYDSGVGKDFKNKTKTLKP